MTTPLDLPNIFKFEPKMIFYLALCQVDVFEFTPRQVDDSGVCQDNYLEFAFVHTCKHFHTI